MSERPIRIGFYYQANLDIIDGSAIWVHSVAETLHAGPRTHTTYVLKAPEERTLITGLLRKLERFDVVETNALRSNEQALDVLEEIDRENPFDVILLRSYDLCRIAASNPAFRGRLLSAYILEPERDMHSQEYLDEMTRIAEASRYLIVQSEEMRALFESLVPAALGKTILLPPAIPDGPPQRPTAGSAPVHRMIYTGKFSPFYPVHKMIDFLGELRAEHPDLEFHVAGDKIHRPPNDPEYAPSLERALRETPGVIWHGGMSREDVATMLERGGVALSLWDYAHGPQMNDLVISTKLLDYCAAGLPVILNRTAAQEALLGKDYPLFVRRPEEALPLLRRVLADETLYADAADRCWSGTRRFTYSKVYARVAPYLDRLVPPARSPLNNATPKRVLIAGHSLGFIAGLEAHLQAYDTVEVREDQWTGIDEHDEAASLEALAWADVILCEWALGNSVWYAKHKRPEQRLIVHLHRFETSTEHPERIHVAAVDKVVFVAPHVMEEARRAFSWPAEKLTVIENWIDAEMVDRPKLDGARFNLGFLGFIPKRKRLDRALDVLEMLREDDPRFRLIVKGKSPRAYNWMWRKVEERTSYLDMLRRIELSPLLRDAVTFEPQGNDVAGWFRKIGFILSMSEHEGNQVAPTEGMASRAIPVIHERDGAADLYPAEWVHASTRDAANAIAATIREGTWAAQGEKARAIARERFTDDVVMTAWDHVLFGE